MIVSTYQNNIYCRFNVYLIQIYVTIGVKIKAHFFRNIAEILSGSAEVFNLIFHNIPFIKNIRGIHPKRFHGDGGRRFVFVIINQIIFKLNLI